MNWSKSCVIFGAASLLVALATACGNGGAVPPAPTALPTPTIQVVASPTPLPPTATIAPTRGQTPTLGTTRTPSLVPTTAPKDMVMAAFTKALATLKTYRVEVLQENRYIAVQLPDRYLQEGADSIVKIGGSVWRPGVKGWQIGTGSFPFFDRANINWYKDQFAQSSQVTLLGPGMAEGVACVGYSANFPVTKINPPKTPGGAPEVSQSTMAVKIWFATSDGFPRRVEMAAPLSLTINFFDFNDPFKIDPPQ